MSETEAALNRLQTVTGKTRVSVLTKHEVLEFQASEGSRESKKGGGTINVQTANKGIAHVAAVASLACADVLTQQGTEHIKCVS